ncbi:hypothetical protein Y032_0643g1065 [Ancylostoma ceylanicum]|uniref:Uncharacterized protein n=1 Tax=Ancylostoma ceylanicum TaxID=53326 RepID=A0A016WKB8_9BILA|nr:hypothetical protein Y032_0643g1065 [Ancylostoma ceylanicum]
MKCLPVFLVLIVVLDLTMSVEALNFSYCAGMSSVIKRLADAAKTLCNTACKVKNGVKRDKGGIPGERSSNNVTKGHFEQIANKLGKCKICVDDWDRARLDSLWSPQHWLRMI